MFLPKKCPNKKKDQDQNQTPEESTSDIQQQQWVRIKFNNNSFVAKYRSSVGPTKKHRTSRKQRKTRNNFDSADTATVARPSKSTRHHESEPKQKQTNGVMSEKPNCAGKFSNSNHLKEQQLRLRNILSSQRYKRARQETRYEKLPFKTGFLN